MGAAHGGDAPPVTLEVVATEAGYRATVLEFPHVYADGPTRREAVGAAEAILERREADRLAREEPVDPGWPNGRLTVRVPRSVHHRLLRLAESEGVSLNNLLSSV